MALIDVSELLVDPDFVDDFTVIRAVESVGDNGRATFSPSSSTAIGCVQPSAPSSLRLLPETTRVEGAIDIWTKTHLQVNDGKRAADTVIWNKRSYLVANTRDWSQYGEGYINATCILQDLVDG